MGRSGEEMDLFGVRQIARLTRADAQLVLRQRQGALPSIRERESCSITLQTEVR